MSPERIARLAELFTELSSLPPSLRQKRLIEATRDDQELHIELERLLAEDDTLFAEGRIATDLGLPDSPQEWKRIDRYEVIEKIGEGGMGVVYLAQQLEPVRRRVALKILQLGCFSDSLLKQFAREQQALASLSHSGIAHFYDSGFTSMGRPYTVMEYFPGDSITSACDEHSLTIDQRLELFLKLCDAVQFAHANGVVHGDLKPSNVLTAREGTELVLKLIDFGLARADRTGGRHELEIGSETGEPKVFGSLRYMSPERFSDAPEEHDEKLYDVYALGVILFELLSGTNPNAHARADVRSLTRAELARVAALPPPTLEEKLRELDRRSLARIAAARSTTPREFRHEVRSELERICRLALEPDPSWRYASVESFADDIKRYLDASRSSRKTGSIRSQASRPRTPAKRSRRALAAATLILSLAVAADATLFRREPLMPGTTAPATPPDATIRSKPSPLGEPIGADARTENEMQTAFTEPILGNARSSTVAVSWNLSEIELDRTSMQANAEPAAPSKLVSKLDALDRASQFLSRVKKLESESERILREWGATSLAAAQDCLETARELKRQLSEHLALIAQLDEELSSKEEARMRAIERGLEHASRLLDQARTPGIIDRFSKILETLSKLDPPLEIQWDEVVQALENPDPDSPYTSMRIEPDFALVPLGRNPITSLFEFVDLRSGGQVARARDDPNGFRRLPRGGIIFVLLPGGTIELSDLPGMPNEEAETDGLRSLAIDIAPVFVAKYEITRHQWQRVMGHAPSGDSKPNRKRPSAVCRISYFDALKFCEKLGYALPTELQLRYATRARTTTLWWTGDFEESLRLAESIVPASPSSGTHFIGRHRANPFGLFDIAGNVWEWCADYPPRGAYRFEPGTGRRVPLVDDELHARFVRSGGTLQPGESLPCTDSAKLFDPLASSNDIGMRPIRPVFLRTSR